MTDLKYWICQCGSINDNSEIKCRNCQKSAILHMIGMVHFESEEKLLIWIKLIQKNLGAKVFRSNK